MTSALLTIVLAAASLAAFAQGKVTLCNDTSSLYIVCSTSYVCGDCPVTCEPVPISGPLHDGTVLEVGLYGGTSSVSMTLQTTVLLNPLGGGRGACNGEPPSTHVICTFPGGSPAYFQVAVWDSFYATPQDAEMAYGYVGWNHIFQMTPGFSISYPTINGGGGSTWAAVGDESPLYVTGYPPPMRPIFGPVVVTNGLIVLSWNGDPSLNYELQVNTNLAQTNWWTLTSGVGLLSETTHISGDSQCFYRLVVHNPAPFFLVSGSPRPFYRVADPGGP